MTAQKCEVCNTHDRILYRCKFDGKDWTLLCQQCLLEIRSKFAASFEFDETWKAF